MFEPFNRFLIAIFTGIIVVPLILLVISLFYCESFVQHSHIIEANTLRNQNDLYEFISQNLTIQIDHISNTQDFMSKSEVNCSDVLPKTETTRFSEVEFDSLIVCRIPVHKASFLGIDNFILGKLNVCLANPHLRILYLFEQDLLVQIYTELILAGP